MRVRRFASCRDFVKITKWVGSQTSRDTMSKADVWKIRPADLRRIAAQTREPERERKMIALAEELEEKEAAPTCEENATRY
jgi:hypothetical protein